MTKKNLVTKNNKIFNFFIKSLRNILKKCFSKISLILIYQNLFIKSHSILLPKIFN